MRGPARDEHSIVVRGFWAAGSSVIGCPVTPDYPPPLGIDAVSWLSRQFDFLESRSLASHVGRSTLESELSILGPI